MARTWFTTNNTADLSPSDLSILNRAARMVEDQTGVLGFSTLTKLRITYKPGMSAREVSDVVIDV